MSDADANEVKKPFQLRAFPVESRKLAVVCAAKSGLTVPEWVDRAVHTQARADRAESVFPPERPISNDAPLSAFCLYIVGAEDGAHKIGVTGDLNTRLSELRSPTRQRLNLVATYQSPTGRTWELEKKSHALLAGHSLGGEWFSVTSEQAISAVEAALTTIESSPPDPNAKIYWTVKEVNSRVINEIVAEARRTSTTSAQLVERMWAAWKANGSPAAVANGALSEDQITQRMHAMAAVMQGMAAVKTAGVRGWAQKDVAGTLRLVKPNQGS